VLVLAVARGFLSAEAAWQAAHVDEDFQAERWGADAEAVARREARWREFEGGVAAARSDTWNSRASLKPRLPRTAKNMVFAVNNAWQKWCC
jgi:hypothetical protein